jgi:hypothetical protein
MKAVHVYVRIEFSRLRHSPLEGCASQDFAGADDMSENFLSVNFECRVGTLESFGTERLELISELADRLFACIITVQKRPLWIQILR